METTGRPGLTFLPCHFRRAKFSDPLDQLHRDGSGERETDRALIDFIHSKLCYPLAGTIYVAFVATLPEAHRKGYAEAVMRHAIDQGRRATGAARMTLHASDMGRPVYRAMGFEPGARVVLLGPAA